MTEEMALIMSYLKNLNKMKETMGGLPKDYYYRGMESFLLVNGMEFNEIEKKVIPGTPKECFKNAFEVATEKHMIYCEGFFCPADVAFPIHHAWVVDEAGKVHEVTTSKPGKAYFGVPFDTAFLVASTFKSKYYGLLDNWSAGWPLFKMKGKEFLHPMYRKKPSRKTREEGRGRMSRSETIIPFDATRTGTPVIDNLILNPEYHLREKGIRFVRVQMTPDDYEDALRVGFGYPKQPVSLATIRNRLDSALVDKYAEEMKNGAIFPTPYLAYYPDGDFWQDGHHRVASARRMGAIMVPVILAYPVNTRKEKMSRLVAGLVE